MQGKAKIALKDMKKLSQPLILPSGRHEEGLGRFQAPERGPRALPRLRAVHAQDQEEVDEAAGRVQGVPALQEEVWAKGN